MNTKMARRARREKRDSKGSEVAREKGEGNTERERREEVRIG